MPLPSYNAYWFLYDHPKFRCNEVILPPSGMSTPAVKSRYIFTVTGRIHEMDCTGTRTGRTFVVWKYKHLYRRAIECNLDIHYAKVDKTRKVNDDPAQNKFVECWLEFGPIHWELYDGKLGLVSSHDPSLDCGGPTFDEAIVKLARLVRRHYGDYKRTTS